ncbi:MAG: hypothetical protein LLG97_15650 [Deltaproteobacteria bacterium]|nr:hypothetical protein [Deltaproteobacteria bacterium]
MDKADRNSLNPGKKGLGIGTRIALVLMVMALLSLVLYLSRFPGHSIWHETAIGNTAKTIELISRMRIGLLKSSDLGKGAVMAVTDEESRTLAEESRKSTDAVERDYLELKALIDQAKIGNEIRLLKEFGDNWRSFRLIDGELLSLAVENSNIKAANLSFTAAARAVADFESCLSRLMNLPASDRRRAEIANLAYQAVTATFMIYSLEAPHINEALDKKMDDLENWMAANGEKAHAALSDLSRLIDQPDRTLFNHTVSAYSKFIEVHKEVVRLSRMNTNIKSLQLSLGRKRMIEARCEEILQSLQNTVQSGRSAESTK